MLTLDIRRGPRAGLPLPELPGQPGGAGRPGGGGGRTRHGGRCPPHTILVNGDCRYPEPIRRAQADCVKKGGTFTPPDKCVEAGAGGGPKKDNCTQRDLAINGRAARQCMDRGGSWNPTGRCTGVCVEDPNRRGGGDGGGGGGGQRTPARQTQAPRQQAARPECPPGWSFHGGRCIEHASETGAERRARMRREEPAAQETPTTTSCPPGKVWDGSRCVDEPSAPVLETPSLAEAMLETPGPQVRVEDRAPVPDPDPFRRRSFADILLDPRYVQGAAAQDRQLSGVAEAAGVRGAPVLAARTGAQRSLANQLFSSALGEDLAEHGRNLAVNQATYGRAADDWQRALTAATGQANVDLSSHGLALQGYGLDAARDQDLWNRWWTPEQLQRQQAHAAAQQASAQQHAAAQLTSAQQHAAAQQAAAQQHAASQLGLQHQFGASQLGRQLGYNRWALGQNNALSVWQTLMNPALYGSNPAWAYPNVG